MSTLGERFTYPIDVLDEAKSDAAGNVELSNGVFVHGVVLKPAPFYKFSTTDHKIVRLALEFLKAEDQGYREIEPDLLPGWGFLDYALIRRIRIGRLKPLQHYVLKHLTQKHLPRLSPSDVSGALKRAGMRLPRSSAISPATIPP